MSRRFDQERWLYRHPGVGTYRWALDLTNNGRVMRRRSWLRSVGGHPHIRWIEPEGRWPCVGWWTGLSYAQYRPTKGDRIARDWELV